MGFVYMRHGVKHKETRVSHFCGKVARILYRDAFKKLIKSAFHVFEEGKRVWVYALHVKVVVITMLLWNKVYLL